MVMIIITGARITTVVPSGVPPTRDFDPGASGWKDPQQQEWSS